MNKILKKLVSIALALILVVCNTGNILTSAADSNLTTLSITGSEDYDMAYEILDIMNQERRKNGLQELQMNQDLMEGAMIRSAELNMYFSHTRPDNSSCTTVNSINKLGYRSIAENIAYGYQNANEVMDGWMNSDGHRKNILASKFKSVGIGVFKQNNRIYYTQIFTDIESKTPSKPKNRTVTQLIKILSDKIKLSISESKVDMDINERKSLRLYNTNENDILLNNYNIKWHSSNENVAQVSNEGVVTGKSKGSCRITATLTTGQSISSEINVTSNVIPGIVKPDKVQNMHVNSRSWSSIYVDWNTVSDVDGYEVYRSTTEDGEYSLAGTTTASSYNDTNNGNNLLSSTYYYYKVRAYKIDNNEKHYGEFSDVLRATTPPLKVRNMHINSAAWSNIYVDWDSVHRASGYTIYRSTQKDGEYVEIGSTTASSYNDTNNGKNLLSASTYYYKVRAYKLLDGVKHYGTYSDVLTAVTAPLKVDNLHTETRSKTSISLDWNSVNRASGYAIYRSTSRDGTYTRVDTSKVTASSYVNKNLSSGKTYYYKVRAYKTLGDVNYYGNYSNVLYTYTSK